MIINKKLYEKLLPFQTIKMDKIIIVKENTSYEKIRDIVKGLIKKGGKIQLIAVDDKSIFFNAKLRDEFNIEGLREGDSKKFRYKNLSKDILIRSGIRVPRYMLLDYDKYKEDEERYVKSVENFISYPMLVKSIDEANSNRSRKINDRQDLSKWLKNVNPDIIYEIDEFIEGQLIIVASIVVNNKILHMEAVENLNPYFAFFEGKALGTLVIPKKSRKFKKIQKVALKILKAMKPLPNGVINIKIFENKKGEMIFLKIQARRPGKLMNELYKYASGIDMEVLSLNAAMGRKLNIPAEKDDSTKKNLFSGSVEYPDKKGKVSEVLSPNIKSKFYIKYNAKKGDELKNAENISDTAAYVVLWNKNRNILIQEMQYLINNFYPYSLASVKSK